MEKKLSNVKPIIFSGPMVRAILEGRKTQTRRVLKPKIVCSQIDCALTYAPGDILWVRESFSTHQDPYHLPPYDYDATIGACWYWADGNPKYGDWVRPKPSIHMPRWASRITLEVTEVRVQRLQEISEEDAEAEGIEDQKTGGLAPLWRMYGPAPKLAFGVFGNLSHDRGQFATDARDSFATLWNSINAKRGFGWDANPWVAAVTFKVHNVNVDEFLKAREAA